MIDAPYTIQQRHLIEVNTDPQRRCYYGVHAKSEMQWTEWEAIVIGMKLERVDKSLTWWRELNDYAISFRGESARREFRAIPEAQPTEEQT